MDVKSMCAKWVVVICQLLELLIYAKGLVHNASSSGSRHGDKTVNIFEALRESHDRQRGYADALIQTHGDSEERAKRTSSSRKNCKLTRPPKSVSSTFR